MVLTHICRLLTVIIAGNILKHKKGSDIVLIPQPLNDLNDPLNWPAWKKSVAFISIGVFSFVGGWTVGGIASGIVLLLNEFNNGLNDTVDGAIEWAVLMLGVGVISYDISHAQ